MTGASRSSLAPEGGPLREAAEITCGDGWRLSLEVVTPRRIAPRAVAVVGHAMMVDRRTLDVRGDGLVSALARAGVAVVAADLRGHGRSGPSVAAGGSWRYDDLVEQDTPALLVFARRRFAGLPVVTVGHSLFGHVALAHAALRGRRAGATSDGDGDGHGHGHGHDDPRPDRLVLLGANLWGAPWEPSRARLRIKRALLDASAPLVARVGHFPARRLGVGSDDEPAAYWRSLVDVCRTGAWRADDGASYEDALPALGRPLLAIAGAGDRLLCHPDAAALFVRRVAGARVEVVGRRSGLVRDPGHMGLVTDPACRPMWERVARFVLAGV